MTEISYAEFAKHITLDGERVIKAEVRTEGLVEAELEQVRWAFYEFCKKFKSIDSLNRGNETSGQSN